MSHEDIVIYSGQELILVMEEGTFGKGYLGGIGKLLYMLLETLYTRLIKCINILFDQIM